MIWVIKEIKYPKVTDIEAAYIAGCLDCDGTFYLKEHRPGESTHPRVWLGQVTKSVPDWLYDKFGGCHYILYRDPPRRNMNMWSVTDSKAVAICIICLPYLRIKKRRAEILIEAWELNHNMRYKNYAYWYGLEHPNWREEPLMTTEEVCMLLWYKDRDRVTQAIRGGRLLALPNLNGRVPKRVPSGLVRWLQELRIEAQRRGKSKLSGRPPQLNELQGWLCEELHVLNKRGC